MHKDLLAKLERIISFGDSAGVETFVSLYQPPEGMVLKKINLEPAASNQLLNDFQSSFAEIIEEFNDDDLRSVRLLSEADERANVVYYVDEKIEEESFLDKVNELNRIKNPAYWTDDRMFNFTKGDELSDIKYFIHSIGTAECHVFVYRQNFPINVIHRGKGKLYVTKSGTKMVLVPEDLMKIDTKIDAICTMEGDTYLFNLKLLERGSVFSSVSEKAFLQAVDDLDTLKIIEDIESLRNRAADMRYARKLVKSFRLSPINKIPVKDLMAFIKTNAKLCKLLPITAGNKLDLTRKQAQSAFLSLLTDDFLYSRLTQAEYRSLAKDKL